MGDPSLSVPAVAHAWASVVPGSLSFPHGMGCPGGDSVAWGGCPGSSWGYCNTSDQLQPASRRH